MRSFRVLDALSATRKGMKCPKCGRLSLTIEEGEVVIKKYDGSLQTSNVPLLVCDNEEECGFQGTSAYTSQKIAEEGIGAAGIARFENGQIKLTILH